MKNIPLQDVLDSGYSFTKLKVLYQVEFHKVLREDEILFQGFFFFTLYLKHFKRSNETELNEMSKV